jgi:siderophore synthetase component
MTSPESVARRVVRQLLEALLFEGLIPWCCTDSTSGSWQLLRFRMGELNGECLGRIRGFGRVQLNTASLSLTLKGRAVPADLAVLSEQLPATEAQRTVLLRELQATVNNSAASPPHRDRRALGAEALDSALHEGHPYHPCFKARSGFSREEQRHYGPESGRCFRLHWLAVRRDQCLAHLPVAEETFWQRELGTETAYLLRAAFNRVGANWQDYCALPVHPWQWRHLKTTTLAPALARGDALHLGPLGDRYRASQSVRSLFNASRPRQACVKLSLGIGNTSSRRHLEPHSVPSAPQISRWLQTVVAGDDHFIRPYPLRLLPEYASLIYTGHGGQPTEQSGLAGELGSIWREGIDRQLHTGERAIPMNALSMLEADGLPFIDPWLQLHGVMPWLEALIDTLVLPVWHLLIAHGIGVEAHAQNSLIVMRGGWPVALMLRDFHDSVEYVADFLPPDAAGPSFGDRQAFYDDAPDDRYYRMGQVEALRELVMDTLFVFNLSELAQVLEIHYQVPEAMVWAQVRHCLDGYARRHPELTARLAQVGHHRNPIATESLLTRTLRGPGAGECHHPIPNALAARRDTPSLNNH